MSQMDNKIGPKNDLQWPSIEQLPTVLFEMAQDKPENLELSQQKLRALFESSSCVATEKIDGTNVSVNSAGRLFGRRREINPTAASYQKTPVAELARTAESCKELEASILRLVGDALELVEMRVFGELVCNPGLYSYKEKGWAKRFVCFGARLRVPASQLWQWSAKLDEAGLVHTAGVHAEPGMAEAARSDANSEGRMTLHPCSALRDLFVEHNMLHVPILFEGTLMELVQHQLGPMTSGHSEGVVVSAVYSVEGASEASPEQSGDSASGGSASDDSASDSAVKPVMVEARSSTLVFKWKQGHEEQVSDVGSKLRTVQSKFGSTLPDGGSQVLDMLYEVASTNTRRGAQRVPKVKKAGPQPTELDPAVVEEAVRSAASKFDSADAYFAKGARNEIIELLFKEALSDLSPSPPERLTPTAEKEVRTGVQRYVGKQFGAWKQSQQQQQAEA